MSPRNGDWHRRRVLCVLLAAPTAALAGCQGLAVLPVQRGHNGRRGGLGKRLALALDFLQHVYPGL